MTEKKYAREQNRFRFLFVAPLLLFPRVSLAGGNLSPLFEEGQPTLQLFSTTASGYGALGEDQSHVAVYVSLHDVQQVRRGGRATVQLGPPEGLPISLEGRVTEVLRDADPRTGQAIVSIAVAAQDLPARTYAAASIQLNAREALALPSTAVVISSGIPVVYRKDSAGDFDRTVVQIGAQGPEYTEIKSGLGASDTVLTKGALEWARRGTSGD